MLLLQGIWTPHLMRDNETFISFPGSGFFPPFPVRGNKRFLHLETVVPFEGYGRSLLKETAVPFKGNGRHLVGYHRLPPRKEAEDYKVFNCLNRSQMTIPAVTDTFSECLVPYWGISMQPSLWSITSC